MQTYSIYRSHRKWRKRTEKLKTILLIFTVYGESGRGLDRQLPTRISSWHVFLSTVIKTQYPVSFQLHWQCTSLGRRTWICQIFLDIFALSFTSVKKNYMIFFFFLRHVIWIRKGIYYSVFCEDVTLRKCLQSTLAGPFHI